MASKKIYNKDGSAMLSGLSFSDLHAMLMFVATNREKGFNVSPQTKMVIDARYREIEEELYIRAYGHNPFASKAVIDGQKPEDVISKLGPVTMLDGMGNPIEDLKGHVVEKDGVKVLTQTFVVQKNKKEEIKDEQPKTFVVAEKNSLIKSTK